MLRYLDGVFDSGATTRCPIVPQVLVVHPEAAFADLLGVRLMAHGFDVRIVTTAAQATEVLRSQPVDCIVCSMVLPRKAGLLLAADVAVADIDRSTMFVGTLPFYDLEVARFAREAGCTACLPDDDIDEIAACVVGYLHQRTR